MRGPVGEEPGAEEHHGGDDETATMSASWHGAAVQGAGEVDVAGTVGEGHLRLEGAVDHLDHLEGDAGDGAGGGEDDDVDGAEGVADGEQGSPRLRALPMGKPM